MMGLAMTNVSSGTNLEQLVDPLELRGVSKGANDLSNFTVDLLMSVHKRNKLKADTYLGHGLRLSTITDNCYVAPGRFVEFRGVYLQCQPNGKVLFKAMCTSKRTGKSVVKNFSIEKYGVCEAFRLAVRARAVMVGFSGTLPINHIYIPNPTELFEHTVKIQSEQYASDHELLSLYTFRR